jgi:hypothetical protein
MDIHEGTDHIVKLGVPRRMNRRDQASGSHAVSARVTHRRKQKVIAEGGTPNDTNIAD